MTTDATDAKPGTVQLSIVIPMFNEEENLQETVDRVAATLGDLPDGPWEIVVVNDGSMDATWQHAKDLAAKPEYGFLRVAGYARNRGRGYALRTGFAAARGRWICSIDADLTYSPDQILRLVDVLRKHPDVDVAVASAYMRGGRVEGVPLARLLPSRLGNMILGWFMRPPGGRPVHTITCVFRAYRREVLDALDLDSDGKDIHLEILSKAMMLGFQVREVPATLKTRQKGKSKFRFRRTATSHLVFALFERPILVFGLLGVIALLLGLAIFTKFFLLWLRGTGFNADRPMMSIMIILFLGGFQMISFGALGMQIVSLRKEIVKIQARLRQRRPGRE